MSIYNFIWLARQVYYNIVEFSIKQCKVILLTYFSTVISICYTIPLIASGNYVQQKGNYDLGSLHLNYFVGV